MLRKSSMLFVILVLIFSPVASVSAETTVDETENNQAEASNSDEVGSEVNPEVGEDSENAEVTELPESEEEEPEAEEAGTDEEPVQEEAVEDESAEQLEEGSAQEEAAEDESTEQLEEGSAQEEATEDESAEQLEEGSAQEETTEGETDNVNLEEEVNEEDTNVLQTEEEDLNLTDVYGRASGEISYDFNQGYYVLDLRAGIRNFHTTQEIKDKWVAFALPNDVYMPQVDDVPSGIVPVFVGGKSGLAVKIPNVSSSSSETVDLEIPLLGVENDNDPHLNLHLLDVDVDANQYEVIGELKGQREIDFSVMEENPTIELDGSITGSTTYDEDEKYYFLDVTVQALNQTSDQLNDLYVSFELPEDVEVIQDENTPANMEILNLGEGRAVALQLPDLSDGEEEELTFSIPVYGVSDAVVTSETISVFKILDASYQQVGEFDGYINVDFSDMNAEWDFAATAQIIPDWPGIASDELGFNFDYEVSNLRTTEVDEVSIVFNVPSAITIEEPDYFSGLGADVEWNGNEATVTFGDLRGGSGYEGYFTATGTTDVPVEELEGMEVAITLYRDGDVIAETLSDVTFEIGNYDDIGLPDQGEGPEGEEGPEDDEGTEDDGTEGDGTEGDGTEGDGTEGDGTEGDGSEGDGTEGDGTEEGGTEEDGTEKDNGDVTVTENGDDKQTNSEDVTVSSSDKNDESGSSLPDTATNIYTFLLIGAITFIAGIIITLFRKRKAVN